MFKHVTSQYNSITAYNTDIPLSQGQNENKLLISGTIEGLFSLYEACCAAVCCIDLRGVMCLVMILGEVYLMPSARLISIPSRWAVLGHGFFFTYWKHWTQLAAWIRNSLFINRVAVMWLSPSFWCKCIRFMLQCRPVHGPLTLTLCALFPQIRFATRSATLCWTLISSRTPMLRLHVVRVVTAIVSSVGSVNTVGVCLRERKMVYPC